MKKLNSLPSPRLLAAALLVLLSALALPRAARAQSTPPSLTIVGTTTNFVIVTWPNPSTGYLLLQSASLTFPKWTTNTATVTVVDGQKRVVLAQPADSCFYRLYHP